MQSLLDDPTFYKLLLNNNESLIKDETKSEPQLVVSNTNALEEQHPSMSNDLDFTFLKKLEFPTMNTTIVQPSVATETSYQSSVFSNTTNTSKADLIEGSNLPLDDFYSKEVNMQINSEITTGSSSISQSNNASSSSVTPVESNATPVAPIGQFQSQFPVLQGTEPIQSKQFHKFYTSTVPPHTPSIPKPANPAMLSIAPIVSKITKPSGSSSSTIHICPFCQRQFKNKPYLARHLKKHDTVKDFKCPFFKENESKCHHLNGEFSRKDTFKAHLKSIHFVYPVGVFKSDRGSSEGRCAGCFKAFPNNNVWLKEHIENNECPSIVLKKKEELA